MPDTIGFAGANKPAGGKSSGLGAVINAVASAVSGEEQGWNGTQGGKRGFQPGNKYGARSHTGAAVAAARTKNTAANAAVRAAKRSHAAKQSAASLAAVNRATATASAAHAELQAARAAHQVGQREAKNAAARAATAAAKGAATQAPKVASPKAAPVPRSMSDALAGDAHSRIVGLKRGLVDGTHDADDISTVVDRIAKGTNKAELFDAAQRAGITHTATTKKDLVDAIKLHADDHRRAAQRARDNATLTVPFPNGTVPAPEPMPFPRGNVIKTGPETTKPAPLKNRIDSTGPHVPHGRPPVAATPPAPRIVPPVTPTRSSTTPTAKPTPAPAVKAASPKAPTAVPQVAAPTKTPTAIPKPAAPAPKPLTGQAAVDHAVTGIGSGKLSLADASKLVPAYDREGHEAIGQAYVDRHSSKETRSGRATGRIDREAMHTIQHGSTTFQYSANSEGRQKAVDAFAQMSARGTLPDHITRHTANVYLTTGYYQKDDHRLSDSDKRKVAGSANGKNLAVYGASFGDHQFTVLSHEHSHNYAMHLFGQFDPPPSSDFGKAIASGEPPVSQYGSTRPAEDWATSFQAYTRSKTEFARTHPERFAVVDRLVKDPNYRG